MIRFRQYIPLILLITLLCWKSEGVAETLKSPTVYANATKTTLKNGLTVLTLPQNKAKTVSIYLSVTAGASDESNWLGSGLSHYVEHMFFKGTKNRPKGQIEEEIRSMGGTTNAYTSHDNTVFHMHILSEHLEQGLDLISDAAFNPLIDPDELEKEREVILSEERMNQDNFGRRATVELWNLTFSRHPYRHPVIGYPDLLKKVTRQDLLDFLEEYYIPNNMILAIVGDVDTDKTISLVEKYFGSKERNAPPNLIRDREPPQSTPRSRTIYKEAQHARLLLGFPGIPLSHPDVPALDVLCEILGGSKASRLYQSLKEKESLVLGISASNATIRDSGLISIKAVLETKNIDRAKQLIKQLLSNLKTKKITKDELERTKIKILSSYYNRLEYYDAIAQDLVSYESMANDYKYFDRYIEMINRLSVDDIQNMHLKYFNWNKLNEIQLIPNKDKNKHLTNEKVTIKEKSLDKVMLSNGLRLIFLEDNSTPTLQIQVAFLGGTLHENTQNNGITRLTSKLLTTETSSKNQEELLELVESWGGSLSSFSGKNKFGFNLLALSQFQNQMINLTAEILSQKKFSEEEFVKAIDDQKKAIQTKNESIFSYTFDQLAKAVYEDHPYALSPLGTKEVLKGLSVDSVESFYKNHLDPSSVIIGVAGDFNSQEVKSLFESAFKKEKLFTSKTFMNDWPAISDKSITHSKHIEKTLQREQSLITMAFNGVSISNPDKYAYQLLTTILQGSAGRLYRNIRGDHGLSYVVGAGLSMGIHPGTLTLYAATSPNDVGEVLDLLLNEVQRLKDEGVTEKELALAKAQVLGSYETLFETKFNLIGKAVTYELFGIGYQSIYEIKENIKKIQLSDIKRVISKYIDLDKRVEVITSPSKNPTEDHKLTNF